MRVLIVDPLKTPYVKDIGEELADLQKEVGGFIEAVYPFQDEAAIICNEEGKLLGLPLNRGLTGEDGTLCDIVAGTFLVTGLTEDGFGSLSDDQLRVYAERFRTPETFYIEGGTFKSLPALSAYEEPEIPYAHEPRIAIHPHNKER